MSQVNIKHACYFVSALKSSAKCDLVLFQKVKMNKVVPKVLHVAVGYICSMFHIMFMAPATMTRTHFDGLRFFLKQYNVCLGNWLK